MTYLVDTSVWSLALRRDAPTSSVHVAELKRALETGETVVCTGIILQELLQGAVPTRVRSRIVERFAALPFLQPTRADHVAAADIRNACRSSGIQIGTVDALLVRLCLAHDLTMLTTDGDFTNAQPVTGMRIWGT